MQSFWPVAHAGLEASTTVEAARLVLVSMEQEFGFHAQILANVYAAAGLAAWMLRIAAFAQQRISAREPRPI